MDEEKIYYCKNCSAEFDPFAEDVKVLYESHGVYVIKDSSGRAHSLTLTTWEKIQRVRELEDLARPVNPANLYQEQDSESESEQYAEPSADDETDTKQEVGGEGITETGDEGFGIFVPEDSEK